MISWLELRSEISWRIRGWNGNGRGHMAVGGKACNKFVLFSFAAALNGEISPTRPPPIRSDSNRERFGGWATKPIEGGQKVGRFHGVVNQDLTANFSLSSLPEVVNSINAASIFLPVSMLKSCWTTPAEPMEFPNQEYSAPALDTETETLRGPWEEEDRKPSLIYQITSDVRKRSRMVASSDYLSAN